MPDGRIMIRTRFEWSNGAIGDGMAPIGSEHPDYAWWDAHLAEQEANRKPYAVQFRENGGSRLYDIRPGWAEPRTVYPAYEDEIDEPTEVTIEVRSAPNRGVGVAFRGGRMFVAGNREKSLTVWGTPVGVTAEVSLRPRKEDAELVIWPIWTDAGEKEHSGEGEYGVTFDEADGVLALHCSTGDGPPDFTKVTVRVTEH